MDTGSDFQETPSYKSKSITNEIHSDSLKSDISIDSPSALLIHNQNVNKDQEISWASYVAYPVKAVIRGTYNIVDFSVKHPTQAVMYSLLIAAQFTMVAADCSASCKCICQKVFYSFPSNGQIHIGKASDLLECSKACTTSGYKIHSCS